MAHIHLPEPWRLPESEATPESVYLHRRSFLARLGLGAAGLAVLGAGCEGARGRDATTGAQSALENVPPTSTAGLYPRARKDPRFGPGERHGKVTPESVTATYNNFYEFGTDKAAVWRRTGDFRARPWEVEVGGLVERPGVFDLVELERSFPLEERVYRHRCVEAWSVVVPWIGFPLRELVRKVEPLAEARYLRFVSFRRPREAPGQREQSWYPWPYYEALTLGEATHELAFLVTGMYGHPLQKQNGAPVRLHLPWKYGFKSIKSVVLIEFTRHRPPVFWNDVVPHEYGWWANVDPTRPHPRWSQAHERVVETGERIPTLPYNGYGEWVAGLYRKGG